MLALYRDAGQRNDAGADGIIREKGQDTGPHNVRFHAEGCGGVGGSIARGTTEKNEGEVRNEEPEWQ